MIIEKTFYAVQCDKCNQICKTAMEYDFWYFIGEAVQFAEESPYPDDDEALKDVYAEDDYPFITD